MPPPLQETLSAMLIQVETATVGHLRHFGFMSVWREAHGANAPLARGHGADPVSSACLHLFPELYRRDMAKAAETGGELIGLKTANLQGLVFEGLEVNAPVDITDHTRNGMVSGDAKLATPEAGKLFSDYIVDRAAALVGHLKTIKQTTPD